MPPARRKFAWRAGYMSVRDGNLVTGFAWSAHAKFLALFLEVLGTRVSL
jgi:hypothetical protein